MARARRQSGTITGDLACRACGYNLRGLAAGSPCPECGVLSAPPRDRGGSDNLVDAPPNYLQTVCVGFVVMSAAGLAILLGVALDGRRTHLYVVTWNVLAAAAWSAGVFLVSARRAAGDRDAVLDSGWFRAVVRACALAWIVCNGCVAAAEFLPLLAPPPSAVPGIPAPPGTPVPGVAELRRAAVIVQAVAMLGLAPTAVFLAGFAAWAGDTGLTERLRAAAWGAGAGTFVGLASAGLIPLLATLGGFLFIASLLSWGAALVAALLVLASVLQLAHLSWWAIRNSADQARSRARLARERQKHEDELARRTPQARTAGVSPIGPGARPITRSAGEHVVPRRPRRAP